MSSNYELLTPIVRMLKINKDRFKSIFDLGMGFGRYGVLARFELEETPHIKESWKYVIDGIDIFFEYFSSIHNMYSNTKFEDAFDVKIESYDLVLLLDVVEHLNRDDALGLLRRIIKNNSLLIVSSPRRFTPQGSTHSNVNQIHHCLFSKNDFKRLGLKVKSTRSMNIAFSKELDYDLPFFVKLRKRLSHSWRLRLKRVFSRRIYN